MVEIDPILANDWYIVSQAKDIQPGNIKPLRLLGQEIVIWRGNSPESPVVACQDWCPHRGVALSLGKIVGDHLTCRYHGWQYNQQGKCANIPSLTTQPPPLNACVKTYQCQESQGYIWVSLGNPVQDVSSFPEWDNPDYRLFISNPYHVKTSPFRVIDNNLDQSHVPFLHEGSIGHPDYPIIENYEVTTEKDSITVHNINAWQLDGSYFNNSKTVRKITISSIKVARPLSLKVVKEIDNGAKIMHWFINVTPIDEESCLMWISLAMNYGYEITESEMQTSTDNVICEDLLMLESHRPARLPLLPRQGTDTEWPPEVHVPCDRASIAYRRWLNDLGITFGVC
ncbi:MAG: aromatic ring-hydroxylating dioxygenase subunit alpha [Ekhidna sp.]